MSEWKECTLGDVLNFRRGHDLPKSSMANGIIPVAGSNGIIGWHDTYTDITPLITVGRSGSIGHPYIYNKAWAHNTTLYIDDFKGNDPQYLYYLLFTLPLAQWQAGSAVPTLNRNHIHPLPISFPNSVEEQKKIAAILSSLDEKIETNRKINARLEELAKALFKSWFIDFEPFGGKMPEDWKVSVAEDFFKIDIGKTPPRKETQWFSNNANDITWVSISDMGKQGMFISSSSEMITEDAVNKFNIVIVPPNTILLSFKLTIGRVSIADRQLATNEAIARFKLNKPSEREYLYLFLKEFDYNSLGCTSSIAMAVNSKIIKRMPIVMPNDETLYSFNKLACPLFDRIGSLDKESSRLAALRDTLLPKLMSGELMPL